MVTIDQQESHRGASGRSQTRRSTLDERVDAEYRRLIAQEPDMAKSFSEGTLRAAAADNLRWPYLFFGIEMKNHRRRPAFNGHLWGGSKRDYLGLYGDKKRGGA